MTATLNGGFPPRIDYPILDPQADLTAGENQAFWFFDDKARYALLNCHIQGGGSVGAGEVVHGTYQAFPDWEIRRIVFPIAGPGDELMVDFAIGKGAEPDGYSIGGWTFRCVEPFVRWTGRYRGTPRLVSRAETLTGIVDLNGPHVPVEIDLDFVSALPPTSRGQFSGESPDKAWAMAATGAPRYEQLCRVTGMVRIPGREDYAFTGTGIRTHRYGRRTVTAICGTSWLSALFPSGRAFGSVQYIGETLEPRYSEAFITDDDGQPVAVRVTRTPLLTSFDCIGQTFEFAYDGPKGPGVIGCEILAAAYNYGLGIDLKPGALDFCHTMTRFRWDGEEAIGMMELGMLIDRITA